MLKLVCRVGREIHARDRCETDGGFTARELAEVFYFTQIRPPPEFLSKV